MFVSSVFVYSVKYGLCFLLNHGAHFGFVEEDSFAELFRGVAVSDSAEIENLR